MDSREARRAARESCPLEGAKLNSKREKYHTNPDFQSYTSFRLSFSVGDFEVDFSSKLQKYLYFLVEPIVFCSLDKPGFDKKI